jgi:hypothetical protein
MIKKGKKLAKQLVKDLTKALSPQTNRLTSSKESAERKSGGGGYSYLPVLAMRWKQMTINYYYAEPEGCSYVVNRRNGKFSCYWIASVKNDGKPDAIILGDMFMNVYEAQEVCEAWEYERVKGIENGSATQKLIE